MRISVTTPATREPVRTDEVKDFLRVTHTSEDGLIDALITAAREAVEREIGRSLINRTLRATLDAHEAHPPITLPRGPVQSVSSFVTYQEDRTTTTVPTSDYDVLGDDVALSELDAADWPTFDVFYEACYVEYVAGYGAHPSDVPEPIKLAIYTLVSLYYSDRLSPGSMSEGVRFMLAPYQNYQFG